MGGWLVSQLSVRILHVHFGCAALSRFLFRCKWRAGKERSRQRQLNPPSGRDNKAMTPPPSLLLKEAVGSNASASDVAVGDGCIGGEPSRYFWGGEAKGWHGGQQKQIRASAALRRL